MTEPALFTESHIKDNCLSMVRLLHSVRSTPLNRMNKMKFVWMNFVTRRACLYLSDELSMQYFQIIRVGIMRTLICTKPFRNRSSKTDSKIEEFSSTTRKTLIKIYALIYGRPTGQEIAGIYVDKNNGSFDI